MKANTRPSGAANTKHEYVFGWKCPLLILCSSSFLWRTSPFSAPRRTVCCPLCAAPTVNTLTDVCSLVGKTTASVARCWGVGVETEKGLLCNSGRAIPRTGGRGRGWWQRTHLPPARRTNIPDSLRSTTFTQNPAVSCCYTHLPYWVDLFWGSLVEKGPEEMC